MTALSTPGAVAGTTSSSDTDGWWTRAACAGANPAEFEYPGRKADPAQLHATAATYCNPCPVRDHRLRDAITNDEQYGIRGGIDMATRHDGVHKDATSRERHARNQQMLTDLDKLTADGFSRDEAAIYLRTSSGHIARILRAAHKLDVLERLDRNGKRIRIVPDKPKPGAPTDDDLIVEIKHLIALGHDIRAAANVLQKTPGALDKALRRRDRHDLLQQLTRRSA